MEEQQQPQAVNKSAASYLATIGHSARSAVTMTSSSTHPQNWLPVVSVTVRLTNSSFRSSRSLRALLKMARRSDAEVFFQLLKALAADSTALATSFAVTLSTLYCSDGSRRRT